MGVWDATLQSAADTLHKRQPLNAWFRWLSQGASDGLVQTVLSNVSPMFFAAFFFGDRASMTTGYMIAMVMCAVALVAVLLGMPRELPRTDVVSRKDINSP